MKPLARVGVLVKVRAVEVGEAMLIVGKMRGHPVEDDSDVVLMEVVDEIHEVLRGAESRTGREISSDLVTPGAVERVLHDGQELNMSEAELVDVIGEAGREFTVGVPAVVGFMADPGAEMDFIDRHRG